MAFKPPRDVLSDAEIGRRANDFRLQYDPLDRIPVPVEEIVEFGLEVSIVPSFAIEKLVFADVDAYLTPDCLAIHIDSHTNLVYPHRTRFSIAHECAHIVLHKDAYSAMCRGLITIDDYKTRMKDIDQTEHGWIEWQANCFAGHLLVPEIHLASSIDEARTSLSLAGEQVAPGELEAIAKFVQPIFNVSTEVIKRRCMKSSAIRVSE